MNKVIIAAALAGLLLCSWALSFAFEQTETEKGENKTTIRFADAPAAVRAAIARITPERNVKRIEPETDAKGHTTFDVEFETAAGAGDMEITEAGDVLEISMSIKDLPPAAAQAIAAAYPKGAVTKAESKQIFFYEVVVNIDGKDQDVVVAANGKLDDDDDDDGVGDDDDGDDGNKGGNANDDDDDGDDDGGAEDDD